MRRDAEHRDTAPERRAMYDNWTYLKDAVKEHWSRLSDMRLDAIDGHHDRLVDHVQVVYGIHREQAEAQVDEFMEDYHDHFRMAQDRAPATPIAPRAGH